MKTKILAHSIVISMLGISTLTMAAPTWDTCAVDRMGVSGETSKLLKVKSCGTRSNSGKWLEITSQENAALATLLTALSLGKKVKLKADFANANTSGSLKGEISTIYLDQ